jgi:hypothetical protein
MTKPNLSEHCVFVIRAWRAAPDSPWEFVLHRSGTTQVDYARSQADLLAVLTHQLQERETNHSNSNHAIAA